METGSKMLSDCLTTLLNHAEGTRQLKVLLDSLPRIGRFRVLKLALAPAANASDGI